MVKKVVKLKEEAVKDNLNEAEEEADFSEEIFDGLEALA